MRRTRIVVEHESDGKGSLATVLAIAIGVIAVFYAFDHPAEFSLIMKKLMTMVVKAIT